MPAASHARAARRAAIVKRVRLEALTAGHLAEIRRFAEDLRADRMASVCAPEAVRGRTRAARIVELTQTIYGCVGMAERAELPELPELRARLLAILAELNRLADEVTP